MVNKLRITAGAMLLLLLLCGGCTVVSADRVFPKLDWYWGRDAEIQREGRKELKRQSLELKQEQLQTAVGPAVTVAWTYPQFYQTWGTSFTVWHSQDLKGWTVLTNVALPRYSRNAVWGHTNDDFAISTQRLDKDFFRVSISQ